MNMYVPQYIYLVVKLNTDSFNKLNYHVLLINSKN